MDPPPPSKRRRPLNAFFVWSKDARKVLRVMFPSFHQSEISRMLGEWWRELPGSEREYYREIGNDLAARTDSNGVVPEHIPRVVFPPTLPAAWAHLFNEFPPQLNVSSGTLTPIPAVPADIAQPSQPTITTASAIAPPTASSASIATHHVAMASVASNQETSFATPRSLSMLWSSLAPRPTETEREQHRTILPNFPAAPPRARYPMNTSSSTFYPWTRESSTPKAAPDQFDRACSMLEQNARLAFAQAARGDQPLSGGPDYNYAAMFRSPMCKDLPFAPVHASRLAPSQPDCGPHSAPTQRAARDPVYPAQGLPHNFESPSLGAMRSHPSVDSIASTSRPSDAHPRGPAATAQPGAKRTRLHDEGSTSEHARAAADSAFLSDLTLAALTSHGHPPRTMVGAGPGSWMPAATMMAAQSLPDARRLPWLGPPPLPPHLAARAAADTWASAWDEASLASVVFSDAALTDSLHALQDSLASGRRPGQRDDS